MTAIPGSRTLKRSRHTGLATSPQESAGIGLPALLVEINSDEPTGIVLEQRINTNGLLPKQMISYNLITDWEWFALRKLSF
jgi:hypothetical protein